MDKIKIGLIVNPISGFGCPLGLKGSDTDNIWDHVTDVYKLPSLQRTYDTLNNIEPKISDKIIFYTGSELLGEYLLKQFDIDCVVHIKNFTKEKIEEEDNGFKNSKTKFHTWTWACKFNES